MKRMKRSLLPAIALLSVLTCQASAEQFNSAFSISIWGLPLASLDMTSEINDKTFNLQGSLKSSALADIVEPIRGTVTTTGRMGANGAIPARYDLKYTYGKKNKRTSLVLANGKVASFENVPPVKKRDPWIEVAPEHLLKVFDPVSGFVVKAGSLGEVCNRTISVFDGEVRADIRMSGGKMGEFSTKGYSGPVITCRLGVNPISGYRKGKKQIEYLRNSKTMSLTFAPVGTTGTYAPVQARIGTQIGVVSVTATRFGG